jgi:SecD/SecF fusion protein
VAFIARRNLGPSAKLPVGKESNMNKTGFPCGLSTLVVAVLFGGLLLPPASATFAQAPASPAAVAPAPAKETPADKPQTVGDATTQTPPAAEGATSTTPAAGEQPAAAQSEVQTATAPPPPDVAATSENAAANAAGLGPLQLVLIIAALFIVPILLGNFFAKRLRMPDYAWKISLVLGTVLVSVTIIALGEFKFGPDLAGGITLIYELADNSALPEGNQAAGQPADQAQRQRDFTVSQLIDALKERVDPTGTREVTIREYGPAIEIIIPQTGQDALEYVKRRITDLGQLEFRITADRAQQKDRAIIEQALALPSSQKDVIIGGNKVAEWVNYSTQEFGPGDKPDPYHERNIIKRMAGDTPEALVLIDPMNVTGEYLTGTTKGVSERGGPAVNFSFNSQGARRFQQLTSQNKPNEATGARRYLGIILDNRLISAPGINETISNHGQISGSGMDEKEVDFIISILNAGSLPAALNKTPISEEIISPTLGAVTVEKGKYAIACSLLAVVLFMLVYYRFAGVVACLVLTVNLLLVLAVMILIKAAFTLPGLAGLVLTIGMAVDANVLIYERIREELRNGAALRMAIRNGFGRAMSAIVDSNVTTILTGVVLYAIGTDQIKGFSVTLILGILTSMYTAIFCARLVFDIAERRGWVTDLKMMHIFTNPNYDFLRIRHVAYSVSLFFIVIGLVAIYFRGSQLLDIDFTGGSSVTFALKESNKMPIAAVRDALIDSELNGQNLLIVQRGETQTRYTVDTSEQSVDRVKEILAHKFTDKLLRFSVQIGALKAFDDVGLSGTEAQLTVNKGPGFESEDGISYDALMERLRNAITETGHQGIAPMISNPNYHTGSVARFNEWTVRLGGLDEVAARGVLEKLQADLDAIPVFPLANKIGGRVSSNMQVQALYAIVVSIIGIVGYLWIRFQKVSYGIAAAVALVHDVLVTLGMLALSAYVVNSAPAVAGALQIDSFQISLTIVAALLTIIGYSLNDTIITFDRLREVRGKSPKLTADMVNKSINQTLSRTILTSFTVFLVVVILYFFGGDGIHGFAFSFLVGVIFGTYSSIYIASPVLLWLTGSSFETAAVPEQGKLLKSAT